MHCYSVDTKTYSWRIHDFSRLVCKTSWGQLNRQLQQCKLRHEDVSWRHYFKTPLRRLHDVMATFSKPISATMTQYRFIVSQETRQRWNNVDCQFLLNLVFRWYLLGNGNWIDVCLSKLFQRWQKKLWNDVDRIIFFQCMFIDFHCLELSWIWEFLVPYFPVFGLNADNYRIVYVSIKIPYTPV